MAVSMLGVGVVTTSPGGVVRRALGREREDWRRRRTAEIKGCWAGLGPVVDLDVAIGEMLCLRLDLAAGNTVRGGHGCC